MKKLILIVTILFLICFFLFFFGGRAVYNLFPGTQLAGASLPIDHEAWFSRHGCLDKYRVNNLIFRTSNEFRKLLELLEDCRNKLKPMVNFDLTGILLQLDFEKYDVIGQITTGHCGTRFHRKIIRDPFSVITHIVLKESFQCLSGPGKGSLNLVRIPKTSQKQHFRFLSFEAFCFSCLQN